MRRLSLVLPFLLLAGCDLYWNTGDDDPCLYDGRGAPDIWEGQNLRNPDSGQCEIIGGGQQPCDSQCGPCAELDVATPPIPDWGACFSACDSLGPDDCLAAAGCRAVYLDDASTALTDFLGCWATAPSGPIEGGSCVGLDAYTCSRHDDCTATYGPTGFVACQPEPSSNGCSAIDCGPGAHCEEQCYPCDSTGGTACPAQCQTMCVPDQNACAAVDCAPGYTCVEVCDPMTANGGGGQCGPQCVPIGPGVACETLTTEGDCTARSDCTPVYQGEDCTCYPGYCECNILTYERCESTVMAL